MYRMCFLSIPHSIHWVEVYFIMRHPWLSKFRMPPKIIISNLGQCKKRGSQLLSRLIINTDMQKLPSQVPWMSKKAAVLQILERQWNHYFYLPLAVWYQNVRCSCNGSDISIHTGRAVLRQWRPILHARILVPTSLIWRSGIYCHLLQYPFEYFTLVRY